MTLLIHRALESSEQQVFNLQTRQKSGFTGEDPSDLSQYVEERRVISRQPQDPRRATQKRG
eukprot:9481949-Pyramimonas_sp.AAC.1